MWGQVIRLRREKSQPGPFSRSFLEDSWLAGRGSCGTEGWWDSHEQDEEANNGVRDCSLLICSALRVGRVAA